ncbi:MAG: alpha-amylase family glycosyl hydrolase, partial [Huintestinicola sp.]
MSHWIEKSSVYHIYPLGFCGCEQYRSEADAKPVPRIRKVIEWIPHFKKMNFNAIYFGPIFESVKHGYDTIDYKVIDRRLGTNQDFKDVCAELHKNGIRVILDGVFNHVGRDNPMFLDVKQNRERSRYKDWFCGINFGGNSSYNDGFWYEGWNNCYDLVKLNLKNGEVVDYLLSAVKMWIEKWDIDGIRFDAADCLDPEFIKRIHSFTRSLKPDFWLMGEIIHGDYRRWANPEMFDCVTNYQCFKGIYSSHNDRNYFEIAHSIEYQMGQYGDTYMYNFVDNH